MKLVRLQRCAADQPAIDIRHGKQLRGVDGLDTTAVKNPRQGGDFSIPGVNLRSDERVHLLGLLGGRVAARADRPHGLIGEHGAAERLDPGKLQHCLKLPRDHLVGTLRLALRQLLAHAQNRHEALRLRRDKLARHRLIALADTAGAAPNGPR